MLRLPLVALVALLLAAAAQAAIEPKCMTGRSLTSPIAQPGLTNCPQYRDKSCCSLGTDSLILPNANGTQLYGFNWDRCGPLSPACQKFFQAESCYFECDPYQHPWGDILATDPIGFNGIPLCASYCSAWFEACKNDYTCGTEWMVDFVPLSNSQGEVVAYGCGEGTQCKTFAEVYDNPQGLCDILWGAAFHYSEDESNCVTWDFALTTNNPNQNVVKTEYAESFCNSTYILSRPPPPPKHVENEPTCLAGRELATPSSQDLKNCPHYQSLSCCGPTTDAMLSRDDPEAAILGYDWTACGPMSAKCEKFFKDQACYFQCDPYQAAWANPTFVNPGTFIGIPVCASYCDSWFEACKDDLTCGNEWLIDYVPIESNNEVTGYTCAAGTQCKSFAEVFGNSRALCDVLWGADYHYSEDESNCVKWTFTAPNPHKYVKKDQYAEGYCEAKIDQKLVTVVVLAVLLGLIIVSLAGFLCFLIYREKIHKPLFGAQAQNLDAVNMK